MSIPKSFSRRRSNSPWLSAAFFIGVLLGAGAFLRRAGTRIAPPLQAPPFSARATRTTPHALLQRQAPPVTAQEPPAQTTPALAPPEPVLRNAVRPRHPTALARPAPAATAPSTRLPFGGGAGSFGETTSAARLSAAGTAASTPSQKEGGAERSSSSKATRPTSLTNPAAPPPKETSVNAPATPSTPASASRQSSRAPALTGAPNATAARGGAFDSGSGSSGSSLAALQSFGGGSSKPAPSQTAAGRPVEKAAAPSAPGNSAPSNSATTDVTTDIDHSEAPPGSAPPPPPTPAVDEASPANEALEEAPADWSRPGAIVSQPTDPGAPTLEPPPPSRKVALFAPKAGKPASIRVYEVPTKNGTPPVVVFTSKMTIDTDGAGGWWRKDKTGQPHTSLRYPNGESLNPAQMPFIVVPLDFHHSFPKVGLGDIAAVSYQGKTTYAIVGDKGPAGAVGEGSIALAASFGFSTDPQKGGVDGGVQYLIFPGSRDPTPPREAGPVQLKGRRLLEESGLLLR